MHVEIRAAVDAGERDGVQKIRLARPADARRDGAETIADGVGVRPGRGGAQ